MPIATNPYHIEGPLEGDAVFVGRAPVFAWIAESLNAGERLLALYGLPRVGKTSLVRHLPGRLGACSIHALNSVPTSETWERDLWLLGLRQDIVTALAAEGRFWDDVDSEAGASPSWSGLRAAVGDARLVVIIDGLSFYQGDQATWRALLDVCGELTESDNVHVILCIQGHPQQVPALGLAALDRAPSMLLDPFTEAETETLLVECGRRQLIYDYDAVRSLHQWTGGHPFLLQLFGYALYEIHSGAGRVDIHAVNRVVPQIVGAADSLFQFIWGALSPQARVALSALGEGRGRHELFTRRDVHDFLRWARVRIPPSHIDAALVELATKGLLIKMGADSYRKPIKLMTQWLRDRKGTRVVLDEVHRYRQSAPPSQTERPKKPIRWTALISWAMSIVIIASVVYLWTNRDTLDQPGPDETPVATSRATPAVAPSPTPPPKRMIAYSRKEDNSVLASIFVVMDDGSDPTQLTDDQAEDESPIWSPDGRRLLFSSNIEGNRDIWVMDADGDRQQNLTRHPEDDWLPAWSRQGDAIAFASHRDGNWEIYTARADGSRPIRLTDHQAADLCPSWSPDGQRLAFASQRDGNWEVYVVNRDGSGLQRLTENDTTDFAPSWSPKGNEIAFETYRDGNMEIYVASLDEGQIVDLTNEPNANEHSPAWSPDGLMIAYHSNQDGGWDIWVIARDGSGKRNITSSDALEQDPSWRP